MNWNFLTIVCCLFLILLSCKLDNTTPMVSVSNNLQLVLQPTFGNEDLLLDETYITEEGYGVQFTDIKCYFTSIANGSKLFTDAALFDYRQKGNVLKQVIGSPNDFDSLQLHVGVHAQFNHLDPSTFPIDNPLNIAIANDMHWDWNPGYIFVKIEAKVDTVANGIDEFNHTVVFHVGGDSYLRNLNFNTVNWQLLSPNFARLSWKFDAQKFLKNGSQVIDLKTEYSTHSAAGQEALSLKVMNNFTNAISVY